MPQSNVEKASELGDRFRTHFCRTWEQGGECQYLRCMFAHGPQELRTAEQNAVDGLVNPAAVRAFQRREERALKAQAKAQAKAVADAKAFASTEEALSTSSCMRPSHCPSPDGGSGSHTRTHSTCYQGPDSAPCYGHASGYGHGHSVEFNGMECYGHGRSYSGQSFTQSYCPSQSHSQSHSRVYSQDDTTTCTPPGHSHSAACTAGYGSGQSGMRRPQGQAFPSQPVPRYAHDHDVLDDGDDAGNIGMVTSTSASASASGAGGTVRTHDPYSPAPPPPPPYDYAHCTGAHEDDFSPCHYRERECHGSPCFTNEAIDAPPQAAVWTYAPIEPRTGLPPCTAASDPDSVCRCLECVRAHFASASVSKTAAAEDENE